MSNWLEEEEKKKAIFHQEWLIKRAKEESIAKIINDNNEVIHELIKPFYNICERANKVNNSLVISRLKIINGYHESSTRLHYYTTYDWGQEEKSINVYVTKSKCIRFIGTVSEKVIIEIFYNIEERMSNDYYSKSLEFGYPRNFDEVIFRRECEIQDITDWSEEKMINLVQCLVENLDTYEEFLPGINDGLVKKQKEEELRNEQIKKSNLEKKVKEIDVDNQNASIVSGFFGGLAGGVVGLILGFVFALFSEIGSCISNGSEKDMGKNDGTIFILSVLIFTLIGSIVSYKSKRTKKSNS